MLNGTLCATERALCCVVENYQTPEVRHLCSCFLGLGLGLTLFRFVFFTTQGLIIPEPLRPYMQGRDFLPYGEHSGSRFLSTLPRLTLLLVAVRELPSKAAKKN
jgi:hypothetical protein